MAAPVNLADGDTSRVAKVTQFGELVTAPISYSDAASQNLNTVGQAFNLATPEHGNGIVITQVIASANSNVSNTVPADIVIYESDSQLSLDELDVVVRPQLTRARNFILSGLNLLVPPGRWVNAKTSDGDILLTIMFYRIGVND